MAQSLLRILRSPAPGRSSLQTAAAAPAALAPSIRQGTPSTVGKVRYVERPSSADTELYVWVYDKPDSVEPTNMVHVEKEVEFHDIGAAQQPFTLQRNGFQLERFDPDPDLDIDWDNENEVKARYYPAVDALLKRVSGATRTFIFDHTLRKGHIQSQEERKTELEGSGLPVSRVHVDYTTKSGAERLHTVLPDEADRLEKTPFAVIQVWRPLRGPVDDSPLGILDVASLSKDEYMSMTLYFPGRTGYNFTLPPDNYKSHRWWYKKGIDTDEAYVFVCYDSRGGRARFTPHTGFKDPASSPDALPRQSIEVRAYVFWENEPQQPYAKEL